MNYGKVKIPPFDTNNLINVATNIDNQSFSSESTDYGILQLNPNECFSPPKFKEFFTLDAMKRLGITPDELTILTEAEKAKIPGDEKVKAQIINELERRRIDAIEQIKEKRAEILVKTQRQNQFDLKYRSARPMTAEIVDAEFDKIKRVQKREIERIIAAELIRRQNRDNDRIRQQKVTEMLKTQAEIRQKKHAEEQKKRQEREFKVQERSKLREFERIELQSQQIQKEELRAQKERERKQIRKAEFERQNAEKEAKMKKFREDRLEFEKQQQLKRDEQLQYFQQREILRNKQKEQELAQLREHNRILSEKAAERAVILHQREREEIERKIIKQAELEENVRKRLDEQKRQKALFILETRKKNDERFRRSCMLAKQIEEEELRRKEAVQVKNDIALQRYHQLIKDREKRSEMARLENEEKHLKNFEKKRKADEIQQQKVIQFEKIMAEKEAKFEEVKRRQEQELKNKNAVTWLKQRIGEGNSDRLKRRIEYENQLATQSLEKKMKAVESIQRDKQESLQMVARKSTELAKRKEEIMTEIKTDSNGDIDIEYLAAKFDIDIEEVKRKFLPKRMSHTLTIHKKPLTT